MNVATLDSQHDDIRGLIRTHQGALLAYVTRLTGDRQRAEDVVQETMLRAWQRPEITRADRGPVRPWLFTVARHIVIDQARARKARPREVMITESRSGHDDSQLDGQLAALDINRALAALRPRHREVLIELYFRDRTIAETAEILGIPEGTVKSRSYYALRALRASTSVDRSAD